MTWTGSRIFPKPYRLPRIKCSVAFRRYDAPPYRWGFIVAPNV